MHLQSDEDKRIVRYLLADLPQPEAEQLEERYFCEPPFFNRVTDLEEELIRRYLDGKLSPSDVSRFEGKYSRIPELRQKVDFVRHLRAEAGLLLPDRQVFLPGKTSRWDWVLRPAVAIPVFASVPVLVALGFWLAAENARLRNDVAHLRISGVEIRANRDNSSSTSSSEGIVTLILFPGLEKSVGNDQRRRVTWNSGLKEIRIQLELPGLTDDLPLALEVMLVEPNGRRPVLNRNALRTIATTSGRALIFIARPEELPPGDYLAFVKRIQGVDDILESYSFAVLRQ